MALPEPGSTARLKRKAITENVWAYTVQVDPGWRCVDAGNTLIKARTAAVALAETTIEEWDGGKIITRGARGEPVAT